MKNLTRRRDGVCAVHDSESDDDFDVLYLF